MCLCVCSLAIGLCECVHVGNEQQELVGQNNAQGRDEMDSQLGVFSYAIILTSWKMQNLHKLNEPVHLDMHLPAGLDYCRHIVGLKKKIHKTII